MLQNKSESNKEIHLWIALPCLGESEYLPRLFDCIQKQGLQNYTVVVCVNQRESWHQQSDKQWYCEDNAMTLSWLKKMNRFPLLVLDHASLGLGFSDKQSGVGWARKTVMDKINSLAKEEDLMISLDADTLFSPHYFEAILKSAVKYPEMMAISVPYEHPLTAHSDLNRAMLRYEIYMRYYALNLWRIQSPFAYTALGSAMVIPIKSYRKVSGISPVKSGEDFYFLQKLVKSGKVLCHLTEKVFPATRLSDRVGFGTGPALIKGVKGDWDSYPLYHPSLFDEIEETYQAFPLIYSEDRHTPMNTFLQEIFKEEDIWSPLRKNAANQKQFVRACYQKIDGLRILQYLKSRQKEIQVSDEEALMCYFERFQPDIFREFKGRVSFQNSSIELLNDIRNALMEKEAEVQKKWKFLDITRS